MYLSRSGADGCTQSWRTEHVIDDLQQVGCGIDKGGIMAGRRGTQTSTMLIVVRGYSKVEVGRATTSRSGSILVKCQPIRMAHNAYAAASPCTCSRDNANRTPWCCRTTSTRLTQLIYRQRIIYPTRLLGSYRTFASLVRNASLPVSPTVVSIDSKPPVR